MCATCGCSDGNKVTVTDPVTGEKRVLSHEEAHAIGAEHSHADEPGSTPVSKLSWLGIIKQGFFHQHPHAHGANTHSCEHTHAQGHPHDHDHGPGHTHSNGDIYAGQRDAKTISLEKEILGKNQLLAERNREWLAAQNILALNLVSSPGSGKTTLLVRTLRDLKDKYEMSVIEGDQETVNDANRIRATGCKAVQINTGTGCHLEAEMLASGLEQLAPLPNSMLFIENVGNLVCPAMFDLGERAKIAILSVTEGEDKPLKYPHMFRASELMLLNKIDLLPHLNFDIDKCIAYASEVNPAIKVLEVSATTGEGMSEWYDWLASKTSRRSFAAK